MTRNDELALIAFAEMLKDLNSRLMPHEGQIPIGRAIFYEGFKKLFIECGRSFGKSRIAAYIAVRIARERAGTTNFIFGPFIGQMKEIYWTSRLLQDLIPDDEILSINQTEMRITLNNGSFIKVCGAENFEAYRGVKLKPNSIVVIEEAKDIKRQFLDAFLPNLSTSDPILMMIGTPPYQENHFTMYSNHAQKDPEWFYYNAPTRVNPYVSSQFLEQQRKFLTDNGMEDVYFAEYEAKFTKGGHRSIFPMAAKMPVYKLDEVWPKDSYKWDLYVGFDPASSSVFAVVFFLMNPYNKQMITCGEIYADKPQEMTVRWIYTKTKEIIADLKKRGFRDLLMTYDSAARWYANELTEIDHDFWVTPCDKSGGLQGEISCIRGVCAHGLVTFTDATPKLKWELDNYIKDDKGRIKDENDHAWQAWAYALKLAGFDYTDALEPKTKPLEDERRGFSLESELALDSMEELDGFG